MMETGSTSSDELISILENWKKDWPEIDWNELSPGILSHEFSLVGLLDDARRLAETNLLADWQKASELYDHAIELLNTIPYKDILAEEYGWTDILYEKKRLLTRISAFSYKEKWLDEQLEYHNEKTLFRLRDLLRNAPDDSPLLDGIKSRIETWYQLLVQQPNEEELTSIRWLTAWALEYGHFSPADLNTLKEYDKNLGQLQFTVDEQKRKEDEQKLNQAAFKRIEGALVEGNWTELEKYVQVVPVTDERQSALISVLQKVFDKQVASGAIIPATKIDRLMMRISGYSTERAEALGQLQSTNNFKEARLAFQLRNWRRLERTVQKFPENIKQDDLNKWIAALEKEFDRLAREDNLIGAMRLDHALTHLEKNPSEKRQKIIEFVKERMEKLIKDDKLISQAVRTQAAYIDLENELKHAKEEYINLQNKIFTLGQDIKTSQEQNKELTKYKDAYTPLSKKYQDLSAQYKTLYDAYQKLKDKHDQQEKNMQLLQKQKAEYERDRAMAGKNHVIEKSVLDRNEVQRLLANIEQLQMQLGEVQAERDELRKRINLPGKSEIGEKEATRSQRVSEPSEKQKVEVVGQPASINNQDSKVESANAKDAVIKLSYAYVPEVLDLPTYKDGYCTIPPILLAIKTNQRVDPLQLTFQGREPVNDKVWTGNITVQTEKTIQTDLQPGVEYILIKDLLLAAPTLKPDGQRFNGKLEDFRLRIKTATFRLDSFSIVQKSIPF